MASSFEGGLQWYFNRFTMLGDHAIYLGQDFLTTVRASVKTRYTKPNSDLFKKVEYIPYIIPM